MLLEDLPWLGSLALLNFVLIALLAVLFLAWLASMWAYRKGSLPRIIADPGRGDFAS